MTATNANRPSEAEAPGGERKRRWVGPLIAIVVAVVVLAGMLLPALSRARESSHSHGATLSERQERQERRLRLAREAEDATDHGASQAP